MARCVAMGTRLVFDEKQRVGDWVARQVDQNAAWGGFYAMGVEQDGEIVAGIVMNNYNGSNATGHFATVKFGKAFVGLMRHFFEYAFVQCKLRRITGFTPMDLPKAINFIHKIGFEDEYVMRSAARDGVDMLVTVMWADKCRWLKERGE